MLPTFPQVGAWGNGSKNASLRGQPLGWRSDGSLRCRDQNEIELEGFPYRNVHGAALALVALFAHLDLILAWLQS